MSPDVSVIGTGARRAETLGQVPPEQGLKRPETYEKRLEIFARADQFRGAAPVTAAKSRLAVAIAHQLVTLQEQP